MSQIPPLITALREMAERVYQMRDKADSDESRTLDHAGLAIEVLAHVVSGKTIERSFGAPGDWGYGTAIGKGLLAYLRAGGSGVEPDPEDSRPTRIQLNSDGTWFDLDQMQK